MRVRDIAIKDYVICPFDKRLSEVKDDILSGNYVIIMQDKEIINVLSPTTVYYKLAEPHSLKSFLIDITDNKSIGTVQEDCSVALLKDSVWDIAVVTDKVGSPVGIIPHMDIVRKLLKRFVVREKGVKESLIQYQKVFKYLEEEIVVTNQDGRVLFVNPKAEQVMGLDAEKTVGRTLVELVEERVFYPSAALEVLKKRKKVNLRTILKSGETRLSTAVPIFDENGDISLVICTSKNVEEIVNLNRELEKKKSELEQKNQEIDRLNKEMFGRINYIYDSSKMKDISDTILKVAPLDLTILILGETGVGKEVIAKSIHYFSKRKQYPFVKINCGLIPENLIESELFGYEGGAFSGANKSGKIGKIELANKGTLFLDEIGEMPLLLQVKLLEFLQDREFVRVGGTKRIKVDTRVIAATNRDLKTMVDEGSFRSDLYYRLNVIPVNIPPLRERVEDIPILADYFLKQFNDQYNMKKVFSPDMIDRLISYDWQGNVRELKHVLERLVVLSDSNIIHADLFDEIVTDKKNNQGNIICTEIMPLKKAKQDLEKQLVTRAYKIYGSTYKAADALGVDQSTVVKIMKKYK